MIRAKVLFVNGTSMLVAIAEKRSFKGWILAADSLKKYYVYTYRMGRLRTEHIYLEHSKNFLS